MKVSLSKKVRTLVAVGSYIALGVFFWWDAYLERAKKRNAPWSHIEEYRRLPLACIGGPLYVVSLFWLGWSAKSDIHWIMPMLSGVPFGVAFLLIFMAMLNYVTDAYKTFAASAMGATSGCRSIFGAVLPLGAHAMFTNLGVDWACTLLAFLSLGMTVIPFVFIRYGERIRANSKFCRYLLELERKEAEAEERERERARRASLPPLAEDGDQLAQLKEKDLA